jgi:hypothetical protein
MNDGLSTYTESDMTLKYSISNTTVTDNTFCHIMQGMYVGTNYIYTSKTDDNGKYCIFTRTNIASGDQTVMKCFDSEDDTTHLIYSSYSGYGSGITMRSVAEGGVSSTYMYVSTGKAPYSLVRMKVVGDSLYLTGCFDTVTTSGKSIYFSSVKWAMTEGGYHYFLLKKKDEIYIVYRLDLKGTEELWKYYHWDIGEVLNAKGNQMAVPHVVKLSNLMLKAKRK